MKEPSYYGIIPAKVRYDKTISDFAKILYSEITALSNKSGYCSASNDYFAELYDKNSKWISKTIQTLRRANHIKIEIKNGKERRVYPETPILEKYDDPPIKVAPHPTTKVQHNSTSINNKNNNNTWLQKIVNYYSLFWKDLYGTDYEVSNWGKLGRILKPLEKLNEWQLATLIWLHFNWYGAAGDSQWTYKYLSDSFFPLEWLTKASNGYKTYLVNSLEVEWDNEESVKKFILPELNKVE